ncbi:MAG: hypothetical protein GC160_21075 [Acidobacteria bacterium]|nr:hypothetical protein [Acidobacteriota bacterium]
MEGAIQRQRLENLLRESGLGKALPKPETPRYPAVRTGWRELDERLGGGLPRGAISEITGPDSSGRTGLVFSLLARETGEGAAAAYVDATDALDPRSALEAGVDLARLLWVRCDPREAPRYEKAQRVDQAWQASNLIAAAGGFGLIVVDLGGLAVRRLRQWQRRPWVRLRQAVEHTTTALVVLASDPVAGSAAGAVVGLQRQSVQWRDGLLLDGIRTTGSVLRRKGAAEDAGAAARRAA